MKLPFALLLAAAVASAEDWPRFRGPNGSGTAPVEFPVKFGEKDYRWKVRIPGVGHSSPVVRGDRIYVTTGEEFDGGKRTTLCLSTDGKVQWTHEFDRTDYKSLRTNSLATSTPVFDDRGLYICWVDPKAYKVLALDHSGKEMWRIDLGPFKSEQGFGGSPALDDGVLVLPHEHEGESSLVAVDTRDGKTLWKIPRRSESPGYATPCFLKRPGLPTELIVVGRGHGVSSLDPKTGRIHWELAVFPAGTRGSAVASPIVSDGLILCTGSRTLVAVKPPAKPGDKPVEVWRVDRSVPFIPTPVAANGKVYLWNDAGIVTVVSIADGKILKQHRLSGQFYGSPVVAGAHVYCINDEGEVVVIDAAEPYAEVARNPLGEGSQCTPAIADGVMYLRTESFLIALGRKNK